MSTTYHALHPQDSVSAAAREFKEASLRDNRRVFGMIVIDDDDKLVGILSMYDILLFFQPKHAHLWGQMNDIDVTDLFNTICRKSKDILVGDIMTTEIITVSGDTHIFAVLEIMNKQHIRRIPVVENDQVVGIVYISDLFFYLVDQMI